jgi:lysophospholipase L1-like esterase
MKYRLIIVGLTLCHLLGVNAATPDAAPGTVVVLGSSTALGTGASSYSKSWAGLLTSALAGRGYSVQNVSISGTATGDSLARFDHDVAPSRPSFVILATSLANEPATTAAPSYLQNTLLLIQKVEAIGAIPIVVAPYPYIGFTPAMYSSIKDIYASLAAEGVPVLDFLDGADDGQGHWVAGLSQDGTHPTDTGHRLLFDSIPVTLFDALQRRAAPVNPPNSGWWVQKSDNLTEGDIEIRPDTATTSWTVSFWIKPLTTETERALLTLNGGWLELRRAGAAWNLWRGGNNLATLQVSGPAVFHHVALTYQSITGTLRVYVDARLLAQTILAGANPLSVFTIGGDAGYAPWNSTGDAFADILLYRAPLALTDIQAIRTGQTPWKSVAAWLPLAYSPDRPWLNLAASAATAIVHGSWNWSSGGSLPYPSSMPGRASRAGY